MTSENSLAFTLNHFDIKAVFCFYNKEFPAAFCNSKKIIRNTVCKLTVIRNYRFFVRRNRNRVFISSVFNIQRIKQSLNIVYTRLYFRIFINIGCIIIYLNIKLI